MENLHVEYKLDTGKSAITNNRLWHIDDSGVPVVDYRDIEKDNILDNETSFKSYTREYVEWLEQKLNELASDRTGI